MISLIGYVLGGSIGGVPGANLLGLADIVAWVGVVAFILIIVRVVEYFIQKSKK